MGLWRPFGSRLFLYRLPAHLPTFIYVAGYFNGSLRLGDTNLTGAGGPDSFIARLAPIPDPVLQITRSDDQAVLSWPVTLSDFQIQSAVTLAETNAWNPIENTPLVRGARNVLTQPFAGASRFFRLK